MERKRNSSLIIKAIMLLLALIIMIFVASLAWFSDTSNPVHATGVSAKTTTSKYFDMAVGFESSVNGFNYTMSQYSKNFNLRDVVTASGEHYDVLNDFSPVDITGDGVTLVRPSMQLKNVDIDRNSATFTTVTPNKEYICFDMYFRASEPCQVFLDKGSFVKGAIEETPGDGNLIQLTKTDNNRKADEGNYSKDAIVGSVRVSFVDYSEFIEGEDHENLAKDARLLWLPRPDIHLNTTENSAVTPWSLSQNLQPGEVLDEYDTVSDRLSTRFADTYTHHYYRYDYIESENAYVGVDDNYSETVTSPDRISICDVEYKNGDYYYGKIQVNIWIEGCDAEARRTMAGGQFQVNFDLAGS